jgi:hypothetical protein
MKFGGHETFAVREGWLHKGLKLLLKDSSKLQSPDVADWLGVGRNMGKSIKHWLLVTGLARVSSSSGRELHLEPTKLGSLVWERDPYFLQSGTWWALHVEVVNCEDHAVTWWWFFNRFSLTKFDRSVCLASLKSYLDLGKQRVPAQKTLQRDVACLIGTYATFLPAEQGDPEEADDCPFRELGLLTYSRSTGACSLATGVKPLPPEILGYALSKSSILGAPGAKSYDVTLREAAGKDGGPGKAFIVGPDALFELALKGEQLLGRSGIEVAGLGAERTLRLPRRTCVDWLESYYDRLREQRHVA